MIYFLLLAAVAVTVAVTLEVAMAEKSGSCLGSYVRPGGGYDVFDIVGFGCFDDGVGSGGGGGGCCGGGGSGGGSGSGW